jgi:hypothetical protein
MELVHTAIAWWEGKVEGRRAPNHLKKQASLSATPLKGHGNENVFPMFIYTVYRTALQRKNIYVFLFWELRGLSLNLHIHMSKSDFYIPRFGPHISCRRIGRSIVEIYKSLTDT